MNKMKISVFVKLTYFGISELFFGGGGGLFKRGLIKLFLLKRGANKRGGLKRKFRVLLLRLINAIL